MADLILHYASDNASLCIRLALEVAGEAYDTQLVDRAAVAQKSERYLAMNPNGLIPVLETPDGVLFYPSQYIAAEYTDVLAVTTRERLAAHLTILDGATQGASWISGAAPTILDCYLCPMLRWMQLYPMNAPTRPVLRDYPNLHRIAVANEPHAATKHAQVAEGLGDTPFSAPTYPNPPEGSAL